MRSHAKPLPPATDLSDTIGAFWDGAAAAAQISRRRSCRRAGGAGRGVTGAVIIWQTVAAQVIGGSTTPDILAPPMLHLAWKTPSLST
jgi:hypothetical protein